MEEEKDPYNIGARYYEGRGVEVDKVEAAKLFRSAAEEGHVTAQYRLAVCYELGDGVNQDKAESFKWYQEAAKQRHIIAQFRTGACYELGDGVKQDKVEALRWFQEAASQGNLPSQKRVIKLKSELFGHSNTADQLNLSDITNSNISKNHENPTSKKLACKDFPIKSTNSIASQKQSRCPRKKNQKQNDQIILSPEKLKKAEEAARKAMDELIAEEEAELKKKERPVKDSLTQTKGKSKTEKNKKGKAEPAQTSQIPNLKKETKKPDSVKPVKVSDKKSCAVKKPPTVMSSPQTKKQSKPPKQKKKGHPKKIAQATQPLNNSHTLILPETPKRNHELTDEIEKLTKNTPVNQSDRLVIPPEIKEQEKKTELDEEENITVLAKLMEQPKQTVISLDSMVTHDGEEKATEDPILLLNRGEENNNTLPEWSELIEPDTLGVNSIADTHNIEEKTVVDETQPLHTESKPESILDHHHTSSHLCQTVENPTPHMCGEPGETPYFSGQIQYIQVPVPFLVKIPVYIPIPMTIPTPNISNTSSLWVPRTQITYEGDKKIISQWNDTGRGSIHIYHPNSEAIEQENKQLNKRLCYLENLLKRNGYQIKDQWEHADNDSSYIIHHGGEAAKQKNDELKSKISYLEKFLQENNIEASK